MPETSVYQGILENLNEACVVLRASHDTSGKFQRHEIIKLNPATEKLFGFPAMNMLGMDIRDVWTAAFGGGANQEFYEFFVPGTEKNISGQGEVFCPRDGNWFSVKIFPIGNTLSGVIFQDISAVRIKELNEKKQELLSILAHDIRSPISNISGLTEILLATNLSDEQSDYALMINQTASELCIFVNTILDAAKNSSGKNCLIENDFDLLMVIDIITDLFSLKVNSKGLELSCEIEKNVPLVLYGDSMRMKQIMMNIVSNACKFTDSGQIRIKISCQKTTKKQLKLILDISDTGKGIERKFLESILEPFTREEKESDIDGWGLGMNIVRQNLKLMGGEISIKSQPGQGSHFHIILPMKEADEHKSHYDIRKFQPRNVLIIEPEESTRNSLTSILERGNCNVYPVKDIEQVMQSDFFRYKFSGRVIINVDHPGFQTALKGGCVNFLRNCDVQWIGLTRSHKLRDFHKFGLNNCIPKPVRFAHLFSCLF